MAIAPEPTAVATAVVRANGVVKRWGETLALAGATLEVGPGITGLIGANGSGKTTLLGLLLGLHAPDEGRLEVLGLDPTTAGPEVRARVGYSPEHHLLPPDVKAVDFVRHIGELHGLPRREATGRASDMLWQVGLGEERVRPLGTFSTGQRQRVKLAQAIVHDPRLVLLDEPTEGLDPVQRDDMLALIRRIGSEFGIHILLSSHVLDEVEQIADNVIILNAGQLVAAGHLGDLQRGGGGVVLELAGDPQLTSTIAAELEAAGYQVTPQGVRLLVHGPDPFDAVRDAVARHEAPLRSLDAETRTLEDVYLGGSA
jgi:ABC-2 type transport system ATP-binding protein